MGKSWSLDFGFEEKRRRVEAKARALGISESEAYRLCVVEYETGIAQNETTTQTKNAYNKYMTEAPRPGSDSDRQLKYAMQKELIRSAAEAKKQERNLERAAKSSVKARIDAKHGVGAYDKAITPSTKKSGWLDFLKIKMPSVPSIDVKMPSIGLAGKSLIGILVVIVIVFLALIALGYSGLGSSVGEVGVSEYKRKRN